MLLMCAVIFFFNALSFCHNDSMYDSGYCIVHYLTLNPSLPDFTNVVWTYKIN